MARPPFVSRNGVLISPGEASVSVFNPAIYGAYGVYESMQVVEGAVFEQEAHLRRLARSAAILQLPLPAELPEIGAWIDAVVVEAGVPDCTLRLFVVGPDNGGAACVYTWPQPPTRYPAGYYRDGVTAITFEAQRYLPQAKSLNSLASFMAQRGARAAGVHEAFLHHGGRITEGSNSNVFAVGAGRARDCARLAGLVRGHARRGHRAGTGAQYPRATGGAAVGPNGGLAGVLHHEHQPPRYACHQC
jgi:branched-subunit amino acid aminotransferase/4-amino-4-deoxychorismate lyase